MKSEDHFLIREDDRDQLNIKSDIEELLHFGEKNGNKIEFAPGNGLMKLEVEFQETWKVERRNIPEVACILVLTRRFKV